MLLLLTSVCTVRARAALLDRSVFVSPLLNGTGIATKIFNAVVKGMPVVTTPLGLNGFGLTEQDVRRLSVWHSVSHAFVGGC